MRSTRTKSATRFVYVSPALLIVLSETEVKTNDQCNDGNDKYDHKQGPPFKPPGASGGLDTLVQLCVCVFCIFIDLDSLVLDLYGLLLLVNDLLVELLEQCCQLDHSLLDALDIVVTSTNCAQDTGRLPAAVALEL